MMQNQNMGPSGYGAGMDSSMRQQWAGEVRLPEPSWNPNWTSQPMSMGGNGRRNENSLHMHNQLPDEVVESPTTTQEAYLGSLKATLMRNKGNYIVATFLIGTQNMVSWKGVLYDVGNDYVTIYQPGRDRYIVCDMYSLKYMEFYDTQRRDLCNQMLRENGMTP